MDFNTYSPAALFCTILLHRLHISGIKSFLIIFLFFSFWVVEGKASDTIVSTPGLKNNSINFLNPDTTRMILKPVSNQPIQWKLAFSENIIYDKSTGGLQPLDKVGWHNGAEALPLVGDFELSYTFRIGSSARKIGEGDFLIGYTKVDPDSSNIVSHGWNMDGNAIFLLFDQGYMPTSSFGVCWQENIAIQAEYGDTMDFTFVRTSGLVRYELVWREKLYSGIIENYEHTIWPVAAFFNQGGNLLSATIISGTVLTPKPNYRLIFVITSILIFLFGSIGYMAYALIRSKQKIKEQKIILKDQELILHSKSAVEQERNRIASEMHDDLSSGLTTIKFLSEKALLQAKDSSEVAQITKIAEHSKHLIRNLSEIIWAMNSRFDHVGGLSAYLRRYASEFLQDFDIQVRYIGFEQHQNDIPLSAEKRRNIFLAFKEILHNVAKHSSAKEINISNLTNEQFRLTITEIGGKAFFKNNENFTGNGLKNYTERIHAIQGQIIHDESENATELSILVPLTPASK